MPSDLDRRFDAAMTGITGPGGLLASAPGADGRVVVPALPATLPGFFDLFCMMNAATVGVIAGEEQLTFAELKEHANAAAKALVGGFGVKPGDRVGIAMKNAPAWIICYMAVAKAGGVATLLNGWWQSHELDHALDLVTPSLVLADGPRAGRIRESGYKGELVELPVDEPLAEALAPLASAEAVLPQVMPDDDATILFTSGSTGEAKGAVSTHRAVTMGVYTYASASATMRSLIEAERGALANPPRTLVNVPLFHVTGEVPVMLNSFVIARTMILMPKWDAGEALRLIEKHKVTYFVGVPTMSLELMTHPDRDKFDLSTLTDIAAGGAARPVAHVERLQKEFAHAQPALGYGLTETNAVGCGNFWSNYAAKPASTGRPSAPFVEVAIVGEGERHMPMGERGEVGIRTAANFRGYWNNEAATRAAFTADGFFLTGDIGYLDEDKYLFIVDRKKDIIIRGGENISAQEVEAAIYTHPAVAEASVFGLLDERLGEVPGAVVHLEPGETLDDEGLAAFLGTRLAGFKLPARVWFETDPLPKLGTGKIDKVGLRERYRAQPHR